jgi:hypothetical protein
MTDGAKGHYHSQKVLKFRLAQFAASNDILIPQNEKKDVIMVSANEARD